MIKAVIFDLGNTLIDTKKVRQSIDLEFNLPLMRKLGYMGSLEELKQKKHAVDVRTIHVGKENFFDEFSKELGVRLDKKQSKNAYRSFQKFFLKNITLIPDTRRVLETIRKRGYKVALITNSASRHAKTSIAHFNLRKYFDFIIISEEVNAVKSELKPFRVALQRLKMKPDECLMVGDKLDEDAYAKRVGMHVCWFESRPDYVPRKRPEKFDFRLKELKALLNLLPPLH